MKDEARVNELLSKQSLSDKDRQELQSLLEIPMKEHINSNLKNVQDIRFWEFLTMWIKFKSKNAARKAFKQIGKPALHLFIERENKSWDLLLFVDDYIYDVMKLGHSDDSQAVLIPVGAK